MQLLERDGGLSEGGFGTFLAGVYTRSLFISTSAVSDTTKHPTHPKHRLTPPLTRATEPLRAPPIPYKALKLS
jgi:hypothetical protein